MVLEFPEEDLKDKEIVRKGKEAMVVELFQKRRISSGYAADLLGLCLADFMDISKRKEILFSRYTKEELRKDLEAITHYKKETSQQNREQYQNGGHGQLQRLVRLHWLIVPGPSSQCATFQRNYIVGARSLISSPSTTFSSGSPFQPVMACITPAISGV